MYSKIFKLLSFETEALAKVQIGQENAPCSPSLDIFQRFENVFEHTPMLTITSTTNAESFIPFAESRCKLWVNPWERYHLYIDHLRIA
jgi:hypothetical protein